MGRKKTFDGVIERVTKPSFNEKYNWWTFSDMTRDGTAPVSPEEVDEFLELEILDPTEPDVWEMYHRGLIDKEKRDS